MISSAWAAEAVKQMADTPIYMTYNFFLTAIGLPAIALYLKYLLAKNDEKVREAVALKDALYQQSMEAIRQSIVDWQMGAKERTASLCKKIDDIAKDVKERVHVTHCDEKHHDVKEDIKELRRMFT